MKPVAIFRHYRTEGPGYFARALERAGISYEILHIDEGVAVPARASDFAGLVFMGGPMSVNDDLAWIEPELALIRDAVARGVPLLGHCLGGQLMSKALGGTVTQNPVKEIGWHTVEVTEPVLGARWFGAGQVLDVFQWHGETFTIPPGATRVARSRWCENQAFVMGPHIGLQCHVEMTEDLVESWCRTGAREIARSPGPAVQDPQTIRAAVAQQLPALHQVADRIYATWLEGVGAGD